MWENVVREREIKSGCCEVWSSCQMLVIVAVSVGVAVGMYSLDFWTL